MIDGTMLTPLRIITGELGDVLHAMKQDETSFCGFGEAYFSTVKKNTVKAWKRHQRMMLNLVVPCGEIKFVLYDDRISSPTFGEIYEVTLSRQNYQRLTVPPMVCLGFKGVGDGLNMLLNIANILHDPIESEKMGIDYVKYDWRQR